MKPKQNDPPWRRRSIIDSFNRTGQLTTSEMQTLVDALERLDPHFFDTYPTDHGGKPTRRGGLKSAQPSWRDCGRGGAGVMFRLETQ
jgi:hypothetical protein